MPDFLGIPWGASQHEADTAMHSREGVVRNTAQSGSNNLVFHGGLFAGKDVAMWVLQFIDDRLHTAKILIAPPRSHVMEEFQDLNTRFTREYGEATQSGIIVNPPYKKGQELQAIAAGRAELPQPCMPSAVVMR